MIDNKRIFIALKGVFHNEGNILMYRSTKNYKIYIRKKLTSIKIAFLIVFLIVKVEIYAQPKSECSYVVDTFLCVKYGDSLNMLQRNFGNPRFFTITETNTYIFEDDSNILVFDKRNIFIEKKTIPEKILFDLIDVIGVEDGFVLLGSEKAYLSDHDFKIYDTIECEQGCLGRKIINLRNKIYYYNSSDLNTLIEFDIENNLFKMVDATSIWPMYSCNNFPNLKGSKNVLPYHIAGLTEKLVVLWKGLIGMSKWEYHHALFNITKCSMKKLQDFNYHVNLTRSTSNCFKFIDDSTAVFSVQYFSSDIITCDKDSTNSKIEYPRKSNMMDCVFYRIKFFIN